MVEFGVKLNDNTHLEYLAYSKGSIKVINVCMKRRGKGKTWKEDHGRMALNSNMETHLHKPKC